MFWLNEWYSLAVGKSEDKKKHQIPFLILYNPEHLLSVKNSFEFLTLAEELHVKIKFRLKWFQPGLISILIFQYIIMEGKETMAIWDQPKLQPF